MAKEMVKKLRTRYAERRSIHLVSLLKYLTNPSCVTEKEPDALFKISNKKHLEKKAKELLERLFKKEFEVENEVENVGEDEEERGKDDFASQLQKAKSDASTIKKCPANFKAHNQC